MVTVWEQKNSNKVKLCKCRGLCLAWVECSVCPRGGCGDMGNCAAPTDAGLSEWSVLGLACTQRLVLWISGRARRKRVTKSEHQRKIQLTFSTPLLFFYILHICIQNVPNFVEDKTQSFLLVKITKWQHKGNRWFLDPHARNGYFVF